MSGFDSRWEETMRALVMVGLLGIAASGCGASLEGIWVGECWNMGSQWDLAGMSDVDMEYTLVEASDRVYEGDGSFEWSDSVGSEWVVTFDVTFHNTPGEGSEGHLDYLDLDLDACQEATLGTFSCPRFDADESTWDVNTDEVRLKIDEIYGIPSEGEFYMERM